ncbi:Gfo/Idh/MocA family protein [Marinobacterium rhizophilum]|uniref:Gfo/Idh/MocA family oxidoreductase n=1 Tax=Marinobacterium rhizophilum TaxID=420402 RepID=A0ABY5HKF6_9GAMM|nr:Gfo/Idh/MocA family oxidoreductase [Marinobacterium rhizophilum]UTW12868.1 Gfo/Idh/MocA family oxidoreductase [Marinobacterium rhizophilum]
MIRFAIMGSAKIARTQLAPAILEAGYPIQAVASRSLEQARAFATEVGAKRYYDNYDALFSDDQVDAVYIPLPNHLHVPWAIKAMAAGKHVLCEKPIALDRADLQPLLEAAARFDGTLMEAFMVCHHAQWSAIHQKILPAIGDLRALHAVFSYGLTDAKNVRNVPEWGGGGLLDIGCYTVLAGRWCFGADPVRVQSSIDLDPQFGIDRQTSALLDYGQGRTLSLTVCTQAARYQRLLLLGSKGWAELEIPFNAPNEGVRIRLAPDGGLGAGEIIEIPPQNQYASMVRAFAEQAQSGKAWNNLEQSAALIQVLDQIRTNAKPA